jgi:hypothetical protein
MILISVPLGFILDVIHDFLVHIIGHGSAILAAVHVSLTGLAFLLILLPLCLALRIKEISDILNLIRQRLF